VPQQLNDCVSVTAWISLGMAPSNQLNNGLALNRLDNAPPAWYALAYTNKVIFVRDDRHLIKDLRIDPLLFVEPDKGVTVALDLIPDEAAIDGRQVDSHLTLADAKLLDDARAVVGVFDLKVAPKRGADVSVSHRYG
jgi:hypothetical protein